MATGQQPPLSKFWNKVLQQNSATKFCNKVLEQSSATKFWNKVLQQSSATKFWNKTKRRTPTNSTDGSKCPATGSLVPASDIRPRYIAAAPDYIATTSGLR